MRNTWEHCVLSLQVFCESTIILKEKFTYVFNVKASFSLFPKIKDSELELFCSRTANTIGL